MFRDWAIVFALEIDRMTANIAMLVALVSTPRGAKALTVFSGGMHLSGWPHDAHKIEAPNFHGRGKGRYRPYLFGFLLDTVKALGVLVFRIICRSTSGNSQDTQVYVKGTCF